MTQGRIIKTERLVLDPISDKYCQQYYVDWLNDREVNRYLAPHSGYNIDMLQSFIKNIVDENKLMWAINVTSTNHHIGNIKIDPISSENVGEYGIMIGDKRTWGMGYAKEATLAVIDYCRKYTSVRRIELGYHFENSSAGHLYSSLGFKQDKEQSQIATLKHSFAVVRMYLVIK